MPTLKGSRPRPRVGLVGNFEEKVVHSLQTIFPTTWAADSFIHLEEVINPAEIDLIIIAPNFQYGENKGFLKSAHVISFSDAFIILPGPCAYSDTVLIEKSSTEEYIIPDQPIGFYNLLENNVSSENAKGWPLI